MSNDEGCGCFTIVLLVIVLLALLIIWPYLHWKVTYADGTVMNTFVSDGETYITVQLDNGKQEVFSNNDNLLHNKFDSNDLFIELKVGEHYHFKLSGYRIPVLSSFRNILSIEQTEPRKSE